MINKGNHTDVSRPCILVGDGVNKKKKERKNCFCSSSCLIFGPDEATSLGLTDLRSGYYNSKRAHIICQLYNEGMPFKDVRSII